MHWKFTELFSISVEHDRYPSDPASEASPVFSLVPTAKTQQRMRALGWIARSFPNGILVFAEKVIDSKGQDFFRAQPTAEEEVSFWIVLNNSEALSFTRPFHAPLPYTSGLSRLFFFDNLAPVAVGTDVFRLTAQTAASVDDLAGRIPVNFLYKATDAQTKSIEVKPLSSGSPVVTQYNLSALTQDVYLELEEGTLRFTPKPAGPSEIVVTVAERADPKTLGIVRIFNTLNLPVLDKNRNYHIPFAQP